MTYFYVYRLTCTHPAFQSKGPIYYYGSRQSEVLPHFDKYMSSSKLVKDVIKVIGMKYFLKKILAIYFTREEALQREIEIHARFDVKNHPLFFNQANQTSTGFITAGPLTQAHKLKISEKKKGSTHSVETKKLLSILRTVEKRKPLSEEHKQNISKSLKNRKISETYTRKPYIRKIQPLHSEETKQKISVSQKARYKGEKKLILICPWCGKSGYTPGIKSWHFNNCKQK